jgi:hypothetical protein
LERNITEIHTADSGKPFTVNINTLRKRLAAIGRKKSIGPDGVPGVILKLGGEAMIPYLARLMDITMKNNAIPGDWQKAIVVPIYVQRRRQICSWKLLAGQFDIGGL